MSATRNVPWVPIRLLAERINAPSLRVPFVHDRIMPIPRSASAPAHVTIDGHHYCSFRSVAAAEAAATAWAERWPAVEGRRLMVVTS